MRARNAAASSFARIGFISASISTQALTDRLNDNRSLLDARAAIVDFSGAIIEPAIDRVIADHAYPTWPTVGEVVKAVRAQAERNYRPVISVAEPPPPPLTDEQRERANEILKRGMTVLHQAKLDELERRAGKPVDTTRPEFERREAERLKRMTGDAA